MSSPYCLSQTPTGIFDITNHPSLTTSSVWYTVVHVVDFLPALLPRAMFSSLLVLLLPSFSKGHTSHPSAFAHFLYLPFCWPHWLLRSPLKQELTTLKYSSLACLHPATSVSPQRYCNTKYNNRIAHLSHLTSFQPLSFSPKGISFTQGFETEQL